MKICRSLIFKTLSVLLIIAVLSSFALISIEYFHDCSGENCPICRAVCDLQKITGQAVAFTASAVFTLLILCIAVSCAVHCGIAFPLFKVKLLN